MIRPHSRYCSSFYPAFLGGVTGGAYTEISSIDHINIFTPSAAGDRAYNHQPVLWRRASDNRVWLFWKTHSTNEDQLGQYISGCYSDDNGDAWSSVVNVVAGLDAMEASATQSARPLYPIMVVSCADSKDYLIVGVESVGYASGVQISRSEIGILAVEILTSSLGSPGYITGTPTIYSEHSSKEIINTEWLRRGVNNIYPIGNTADVIESITFYQDGKWIKLGRGYNSLTTNYVYSCTSYDGIVWSDAVATAIPNSPSRLSYIYHSTNKHLLFFNPQNDGLSRNPLAMTISDNGHVWSDGYSIRSVTSDEPVYSGYCKGGGCSYVNAIELSSSEILAAYSIAKEQIAVSRFSLP